MVDLLVPALFVMGFLSIILNTVVGGGGGAVLVPALILAFNQSTNDAIATSFIAITVGALVSTFAYTRQGRVDFRSGLLLGGLTLPGTVFGAFIASSLQGSVFQLALGFVILVVGLLPLAKIRFAPLGSKSGWNRKLTDAFGTDFSYTIKMDVAVPSALITGFVGGIFGAAGGLVLTPALIIAGFPVHIALGTLRLVALALSLSGSLTRFYLGQVNVVLALWLSIGAVFGAFAGARLARVLNSELLSKIVSFGISLLGLALILRSIF